MTYFHILVKKAILAVPYISLMLFHSELRPGDLAGFIRPIPNNWDKGGERVSRRAKKFEYYLWMFPNQKISHFSYLCKTVHCV